SAGPPPQSPFARQYGGGNATAEIGYIHSAEAIRRSRVRSCRQHIRTLDLLTVRACQHHASPGRQTHIKLDVRGELIGGRLGLCCSGRYDDDQLRLGCRFFANRGQAPFFEGLADRDRQRVAIFGLLRSDGPTERDTKPRCWGHFVTQAKWGEVVRESAADILCASRVKRFGVDLDIAYDGATGGDD